MCVRDVLPQGLDLGVLSVEAHLWVGVSGGGLPHALGAVVAAAVAVVTVGRRSYSRVGNRVPLHHRLRPKAATLSLDQSTPPSCDARPTSDPKHDAIIKIRNVQLMLILLTIDTLNNY